MTTNAKKKTSAKSAKKTGRKAILKQVKEVKSFKFNAANEKRAKALLKKYPKGREQSALLPLLDIAQRQCDNWLPRTAI